MKVEHVVVTLLLLLISSKGTFQQFAGCRESFFLHEGSCTPCPDRCATCISDLNCTTCYTNYYGPVCQYTCPHGCDDPCHKEHGYCTYGCADGRFPDPTSPRCLKCPSQCRTCKSMTECFECIPGYYGNSCENRCSSYCERCNKTTGACLVCTKGYFKQERQCRRCPDGCGSCSDENNCSSCQSGYYRLKGGQCIMECPLASNTNDLDATAYLMGDMLSHGCTDTARGQRFVIKTKKPCIQYSKCSPNTMCPPKYEGKSVCGTIQTYQYSRACLKLNESYCRCEPNCTIIEESLFSMALCFTNEQAFSDIKLSAESECSNEYSFAARTQPCMAHTWFLVTLSVVLVCAFLHVLVIIRYFKVRKSRRKAVDADEPGEVHASMIQTECKDTDVETVFIHQDVTKIDETSPLNGSDWNDATIDNVKIEGNLMYSSAGSEPAHVHSNYYPYGAVGGRVFGQAGARP